MSRATIILDGAKGRLQAKRWVDIAPTGTAVEFKRPKRSLPQNDKLWAILTDIADQATLNGRKFNTDEWKCIFMNAIGHEVRALPTLNGTGFFPYGHRSRRLTVEEMTLLLEFMLAWGAENGVVFRDEQTGIQQQDEEGGL